MKGIFPDATGGLAVVNLANVNSFSVSGTGVKFDSIDYTITDGTTTLASSPGSNWVIGSGKWSFSQSLSSLKDGNVTLTVIEGDSYGNLAFYTLAITKDTVAPAAPTVALSAASDSGSSATDNASPRLSHLWGRAPPN